MLKGTEKIHIPAPPALKSAENPGFGQEWALLALNAAQNSGFGQEWRPGGIVGNFLYICMDIETTND